MPCSVELSMKKVLQPRGHTRYGAYQAQHPGSAHHQKDPVCYITKEECKLYIK